MKINLVTKSETFMKISIHTLKYLVIALCISFASTPIAHAKEVVKFAQANQFKLLGYGTEHLGIYPFLGVLQFYMTLPEIKGKYEFKHVGNVYKSPNECLTAVATGAVQISYSGPAFLEQFNPHWKVASAPGIFDNFEHFQRTVDTPEWQKMVKELEEKQNIKIIKWAGSLGSFMLFTNKKINSVKDVAGLRIRYNGATGYISGLKAAKAIPVALPFTEVVSALQTNMIDGLISEIQAAPWYDLSRYAPNLVPITWVSSPMCLIVNAKWWNSLDPTAKEIFTYALKTPSTYQFLDEDEARQIKEWGTTTPDTWKSSFSAKEEAIWKKMLADAGKEFVKDMPVELINAAERTRK